MLAFKRGSLARRPSSRQCIVTLLACSPPQGKSVTLTTGLFATSCARTCPPLSGEVGRGEGSRLCHREAERADRVAAKAQNHYHARPRGEQTCFSLPWAQSRSRVALLSPLSLSLSLFGVLARPTSYHACDISRQRRTVFRERDRQQKTSDLSRAAIISRTRDSPRDSPVLRRRAP